MYCSTNCKLANYWTPWAEQRKKQRLESSSAARKLKKVKKQRRILERKLRSLSDFEKSQKLAKKKARAKRRRHTGKTLSSKTEFETKGPETKKPERQLFFQQLVLKPKNLPDFKKKTLLKVQSFMSAAKRCFKKNKNYYFPNNTRKINHCVAAFDVITKRK